MQGQNVREKHEIESALVGYGMPVFKKLIFPKKVEAFPRRRGNMDCNIME